MKQCIIIISLCIALQLVQTLSSSHNNDLEGLHAASDHEQQQLTRRAVLPRKLKLSDDQASRKKGYEVQDLGSYNVKKDSSSGGKAHSKPEGKWLHSSIRTWREWVEEGRDTSEYFTMDYSHVKKRRPIHNKPLSVAP